MGLGRTHVVSKTIEKKMMLSSSLRQAISIHHVSAYCRTSAAGKSFPFCFNHPCRSWSTSVVMLTHAQRRQHLSHLQNVLRFALLVNKASSGQNLKQDCCF